MSYDSDKLRMGKEIDSGNIDFIKNGYGGFSDIQVEPISIQKLKKYLYKSKIRTRLWIKEKKLQSVLSSYKHVSQIAWLQEEPENRGAWNFIGPRLKKILKSEEQIYIGRQDFPSQAEGSSLLHKTEQDRIIKTALSKIGKKIKS